MPKHPKRQDKAKPTAADRPDTLLSIAKIADAQMRGPYSPQSYAVASLDLIQRLCRLMISERVTRKALREKILLSAARMERKRKGIR